MALFDRDYDRDFGYRAGSWNRGSYDRDLGDRMRSGWHRMKQGARDTFGMNDYDRGYGTSGSSLGYDSSYYRAGGAQGGYNRQSYLGRPMHDYGSEYRDYGTRSGGYAAYDRDMGYRGSSASGSYDREVGLGYGSEFKTRQETDTGDPFGDRQARTPIRMLRNRDRYDTGLRSSSRGRSSYEQDYSTNPISYEPYRPGYYTGYDRGFNRNF
jgi:hypothetical protein